MEIIRNAGGSITYRIYNRGIGVQKTVSESMLIQLKSMPRTSTMPENWYEYSIEAALVMEWSDLWKANQQTLSMSLEEVQCQ